MMIQGTLCAVGEERIERENELVCVYVCEFSDRAQLTLCSMGDESPPSIKWSNPPPAAAPLIEGW